MSYDLRSTSWVPWRRRDGGVEWGPIAMLTDGVGGANPIVATAAPRADFDAALQEFLIGMLTVALAVADEDAWREHWDDPPTPEQLQRAINALPAAFDLDAENGPRFLQDYSSADLASQEVLPIDRLAMDSPGEQSIKLGKTLFAKPARFERLGRPAAAMALITMQTYAPAGGQGNRTSMRGGGPMTTLADPRISTPQVAADAQPLWEFLWMNVESREAWSERSTGRSVSTVEARLFPWLAPTRVSDSKRPPVTPADAHPLQAYFGMPRRIRLEFGDAGGCDLTGRPDEHIAVGFRMKNFGVEYATWKHPLSPHYQIKGEWLPVHPQPGGLSWRDWPQLSMRHASDDREPATVIVTAAARARALCRAEVRLHVFGYDMDNMKSRGWLSVTQPLFALTDDSAAAQEWLATLSRNLGEAASTAASAMSIAIKAALFDRIEDAPSDYPVPKQRLWAETEPIFFGAVRAALASGLSLGSISGERRAFHAPLRAIALRLFDETARIENAPITALRRHVTARHALTGAFAGYGKLGQQLYHALNMTPAAAEATPGKKTTKKRGVAK